MEQRIKELEARLATAEATIDKLAARLERLEGVDRDNAPYSVVDADGRRVFEFHGDIRIYPPSPADSDARACVFIGAGTAGGDLMLSHLDGQPSVMLSTFPSGGYLGIISAEGEWNVISLEAVGEAGTIEVVQRERNEATNSETLDGNPVFRA